MRVMEIQVLNSNTLHMVLAGTKEERLGCVSDQQARRLAEQHGFDPQGSRYISPAKWIRGNENKFMYEFYK